MAALRELTGKTGHRGFYRGLQWGWERMGGSVGREDDPSPNLEQEGSCGVVWGKFISINVS